MMTHQHLCFHLLHRIKRNAYYDDNRGAAQCTLLSRVYCAYDQREQCYNSEEQRTNEGDLAECLGDEVAGRLPGRKPGMKPPFFFRLLAISIGLNWMDA